MPVIPDKVVELTKKVVNSTVNSIFETSPSPNLSGSYYADIICKDESWQCETKNVIVFYGLIVWGASILISSTISLTCLDDRSKCDRFKYAIWYGILAPLALSYRILQCLASEKCGKCCESTTNTVGEIGGALIGVGGAALRSEYERMPKTNYPSSTETFRDQRRRDDEGREMDRLQSYQR